MENINNSVGATALFVGLTSISHVQAQEIAIGETVAKPSIRLNYMSTDNTFRTAEESEESARLSLQPSIAWVADRRLLTMSASYSGEYAPSSEESPGFVDHSFVFSAVSEFTKRNVTTASLTLERKHYEIGDGILASAVPEDGERVATYNNLDLAIRHKYGAQDAKGNINGGFSVQNVDYTNRPEFTNGRDLQKASMFGEFAYRLSGDTRGLIGLQLTNLKFSSDALNRSEIAPYVGLGFSATGKLSGQILAGVIQQRNENPDRTDTTEAFISTKLTLRQSSASVFEIQFDRELDDTSAQLVAERNSPVTTTLSAGWLYEWTSRFTTDLKITVLTLDTTCPNSGYRTVSPTLEVAYSIRRWLSFGINAGLESRAADNCEGLDAESLEDYDRNSIGAFIAATY